MARYHELEELVGSITQLTTDSQEKIMGIIERMPKTYCTADFCILHYAPQTQRTQTKMIGLYPLPLDETIIKEGEYGCTHIHKPTLGTLQTLRPGKNSKEYKELEAGLKAAGISQRTKF